MASSFDPPFSSGVTFTFEGKPYTATSISVSRSASQEVDCTSTDIPVAGLKRYRTGEVENVDIKVDWIGLVVPTVTATANFVVGGSTAFGQTGTIALCTGLTINAVAGDLIKGSATFKVSGA
jgi:hypothetical protein